MKQLSKSKSIPFIWITFLAALFIGQQLKAQNARLSKNEMSKLSSWVGEWEGEGWQIDQQTREKVPFKVKEQVISKLDGLALLVEGKGTNAEGNRVGHHAMAMVYFNADTKVYDFHSLVMQGQSTMAHGSFNEEGAFEWGFEVPQGRIRYVIQIEGDTWTEKGAFSMDGNTWFPIIEMKLARVK